MGINEEEKHATPPPWDSRRQPAERFGEKPKAGWQPAQKKNAHGIGEIPYDGS